MVTNSRKNVSKEEVKESKKDYYLLLVDNNPIGICTTWKNTVECIGQLMLQHGGKKINSSVYVYRDSDGGHILTVKALKRLKVITPSED